VRYDGVVNTPVLADSDAEILQCYAVMAELRPHLMENEFVARIRRQQHEGGYQLAFIAAEGSVKAVAGFRIGEFLAWGKTLYVDDLVTTSGDRSHGHGGRLIDWLVAHAKDAGCVQLHLDSGVQRFSAHRFYLRHRMDIIAHHFALILD
jgi:GNAT superfamily N-acetyltransferase